MCENYKTTPNSVGIVSSRRLLSVPLLPVVLVLVLVLVLVSVLMSVSALVIVLVSMFVLLRCFPTPPALLITQGAA